MAPEESIAPETGSLALERKMALGTLSVAPKESVAPDTEMEASIANPKTLAPTTAVVESVVPTLDFPMEQTQLSPLLAITQGNHRQEWPLPFLYLFFILTC